MSPKTLLCAGVAALAIVSSAQAADAINIAPQPLSSALKEFAAQSQQAILADPALFDAKVSRGVSGATDAETALAQLLTGTGLTFRRSGEALLIVQQEGGSGPQDGGAGDVDALIVTAQKREEAIQDVPIAISAFSAKSLEEQKIEGGFDLLKAIPNVTFSKSNFTSYNFSIRGVGTKAISATTDPGVAVAFNNTALLQNRLFEQEYFDVERVEVLRGPQGTLYGRNATSGVINVISAKPNLGEFDGWLKGEAGNYATKRVSAMVNIPIIEDKLAIRFAGAVTARDGFDYNSITRNAMNGRDLWSGRITVGFEPTERLRGNLIWERFNEDDDRSRTGKQLCHRDPGPALVGGFDLANNAMGILDTPADVLSRYATFSQGCLPGNLYDDGAFGTPNGLSFIFVAGAIATPDYSGAIGADPTIGAFGGAAVIQQKDPYGGLMQSRDLREIASIRDPIYRAGADLLELNLEYDITPELTFASQTAYNEDETYSFQDYNRFNSLPIFTDTLKLTRTQVTSSNPTGGGPSAYANLAPGGIFCDPQIGCSDKIAGFDISKAKGKQFSQEFRLQSSFEGPVNFSAGVNYTKFETLIDYYVMYNLLSALSSVFPFNQADKLPGFKYDPNLCPFTGYGLTVNVIVPTTDPRANCVYVDPNPVESIDGEGHNYFRSKNPYKLTSWAGFGEAYWNVTDALKVTAGLRYTDDTKTFIPVPSQALLANGWVSGGTVAKGYPEKPAIEQNWGEFTGRLGVDWQPELSFTDQTLLYAFYSRGYKGGGANPPSPGFATTEETIEGMRAAGVADATVNAMIFIGYFPNLELTAVEYGPTFEPEFVNAFEVGAKNTLLGGAMTFNATGFFYDYKDYQVSQIRDRTAVNENFDAKVWGLEFETTYSPSRNLRINANLGYLDTEIADGETSIDIMNRTQGDENYVLAKPWLQLTSNCVVPAGVAASWAATNTGATGYFKMCGGLRGVAALNRTPPTDPATGAPYDYRNYPELNGGAGIRAQLGGNELPNAPHWTANIGAQYGVDFLDGWRATVRADAYWQSQSWARIYNLDPYDKLHGWFNTNLSVWVERPDDGLKIELYVKNLLDDTPITDAFLNSDDTGLTTNIFTLDPRVVGLSIRKEF